MEKKDIDWGELTFSYQPCDYSYVCDYEDGEWGEGGLTPDHTVTLSECAGILHYCQECFEGLKAYTSTRAAWPTPPSASSCRRSPRTASWTP